MTRNGWARLVPAAAVACLLPGAIFGAQKAPPSALKAQITADYKAARFAVAGGSIAVLDPGKVLVVQKTGIFTIPPTNLGACPVTYENQALKAPGGFCKTMNNANSRYLEPGEKVLIQKVDVSEKDDKIAIIVVACEACTGSGQSTYYRGEVVFVFPKGYLTDADPGQVEDVIAQVLAVDAPARNAAPPPMQQAAAAAPPAAAPAATSATVKIGQTPDEVKAILGTPEKVIDLGVKQIFVYKDVKITFVNGKVTDAQ
jgi:hypothetical protein